MSRADAVRTLDIKAARRYCFRVRLFCLTRQATLLPLRCYRAKPALQSRENGMRDKGTAGNRRSKMSKPSSHEISAIGSFLVMRFESQLRLFSSEGCFGDSLNGDWHHGQGEVIMPANRPVDAKRGKECPNADERTS